MRPPAPPAAALPPPPGPRSGRCSGCLASPCARWRRTGSSAGRRGKQDGGSMLGRRAAVGSMLGYLAAGGWVQSLISIWHDRCMSRAAHGRWQAASSKQQAGRHRMRRRLKRRGNHVQGGVVHSLCLSQPAAHHGTADLSGKARRVAHFTAPAGGTLRGKRLTVEPAS